MRGVYEARSPFSGGFETRRPRRQAENEAVGFGAGRNDIGLRLSERIALAACSFGAGRNGIGLRPQLCIVYIYCGFGAGRNDIGLRLNDPSRTANHLVLQIEFRSQSKRHGCPTCASASQRHQKFRSQSKRHGSPITKQQPYPASAHSQKVEPKAADQAVFVAARSRVDSQLVTLFGIIRTSNCRRTITLHFENDATNE